MGRKTGGKNPYEKQKFYVFYDQDDNVRYCGTAQQLVEDGRYKNAKDVHAVVSRINAGKYKGFFKEVYIDKPKQRKRRAKRGRKKNVCKNNNRQ